MRTISLLVADAAATRGTIDLVTRIAPADLTRATPCAGWDLGTLLAHMTAQHRGFAAAAQGGSSLSIWQPVHSDDPVASYLDAATELLAAFADPDILDRPFALPEIARAPTFPGRVAIGFHLVDYVVHGWDVSRSRGVPYHPDPTAVAAALPVARAVPTGDTRLAPGAAFAPAVPLPPGAGPLDEILALLGRDPAA
jgi:uncharacterized protein (TIGR03086 family)